MFPPLSEQRCANCRYSRISTIWQGAFSCRRNPPQVGLRSEQWPTVEPDDWCGEWVAREEGE